MAFGLWGIIKGLLVQDETDKTKQLSLEVDPTSTTGTRTTLKSAQSANRTVNIPDADDILVGRATTDNLQNKTVGDTNTINAQSDAFKVQDATESTKELDVDLSGATASSKMTLNSSHSTDRTLNLPDADDTLMGKATADIMTNKTFDADGTGNSITNIENADIKNGAAIDALKIADGTVSNDEFQRLDGVTSDIQGQLDAKAEISGATDNRLIKTDGATDIEQTGISVDDSNNMTGVNDLTVDGDLTVNGTTTSVNTDTLDVEDPNITVNKNGNDATSEGSGLTVERTGTDGSIVYEDALTSKFKIGALGSEVEVADVSSTQDLSGKTFTDELTMEEIATPSNPAAGDNKLYFKSDDKLYKLNSAGQETEVGADIKGVFNYIINPDAEEGSGDTGSSANMIFTATPGTKLRGTQSFLLSIDAAAVIGNYAEWDMEATDLQDAGKQVYIAFDYSTASINSGDMEVCLYDVTAAAEIPVTSSGVDNSDLDATSALTVGTRFTGVAELHPTNTDYKLRVKSKINFSSAGTMLFDNVSVTPVNTVPAPIITSWEEFSPSISNVTFNSVKGFKRRVGDTMEIEVSGDVASISGQMAFTIPDSLTMDVNKIAGPGTTAEQSMLGTAGALTGGGQHIGMVTYQSATSVRIIGDDGSGLWTGTAPFTWGNGDGLKFKMSAPISDWAPGAQISSDEILFTTAKFEANIGSTTGTIFGTSFVKVPWDTVDTDSVSAYDSSNDQYVIPKTGFYTISASIGTSSLANGGVLVTSIHKNNINLIQRNTGLDGTRSNQSGQVSYSGTFEKGDLIDIRILDVVDTAFSANTLSHFSVVEHPDFSVFSTFTEGNIPTAIITDWEEFTPTGTWTTNATYTGQKRRIGDSMEYRVDIDLSGAPSPAGGLNINLPSGDIIDTTKLLNSNSQTVLGQISIRDASQSSPNDTIGGIVTYAATGAVRCDFFLDNGTIEVADSVDQTSPITFTSSDRVTAIFSVPIVGLTSGSVLSNTDEFIFQGAKLDAGVATFTGPVFGTSDVKVPWDDIRTDNKSNYNTANDQYEIPNDGFYSISALISASSQTSGEVSASLYVNNTQVTFNQNESVNSNVPCNIYCAKQFSKGDLIDIRVRHSSDASWEMNSNSYFSIIEHPDFNVYSLVDEVPTAILTAWEDFTPSITNLGTPTIHYAKKRRVGSNMEMEVIFDTGTVPGSGVASIDIPDGLSTPGRVATSAIGSWRQNGGSTDDFISGALKLSGASSTSLSFVDDISQAASTGSPFVDANASVLFRNSSRVSLELSIPIDGWSSGAVVGTTPESLELVRASAYQSIAQSIGTSDTQINYDTVTSDPFNTITTGGSWVFTAPRAGTYQVSARIAPVSGTNVRMSLYKNGAQFKRLSDELNSGGGSQGGTCMVQLDKDDTISARAQFGATLNTSPQQADVFIDIVEAPDFTIFSQVSPTDYIEVLAASTTTSTAADTWEDATGMSITVTPGTWDLNYNCMSWLNYISGSGPTSGNIGIFDSSNNLVGNTVSLKYLDNLDGVKEHGQHMSHSTRVTVTENTTYKLRIRCSKIAAEATFGLYGGGSFDSNITNPDFSSVFTARKVGS